MGGSTNGMISVLTMGLRGEHGGGGVGGESLIISALSVILDVGSLESKETYEPFLHGVMQHGLIARPGVPVLEEFFCCGYFTVCFV